ncbi:class I SAM-dependent methyltransferase, partial [Candidatus Woesearchaeota archaeon]
MNLDKYTPDKRRIIKLYNERLAKHGYTVRGLASGTRGRQFLRFKMVCEVGDLNGKSVLDMGCGFGALLDFFKQEGIQVKEYVGWDINPKIVEIA